jgi:hypothetical protein
MYVPGTIWNDMRQVSGMKFENPILAAHESVQQFWKKSKTAWSPGVHMNNVMANFVIADWHDLKPLDLAEALKVWAMKDKPGFKEIYQRFQDSGALGGMFMSNEVLRDEIAKQLEAMKDELTGAQDADAEIGKMARLMHLATMAFTVPAKKYTGAMEDAYQFEDAIFRLASFVKSIRYGKTDIEAGRIARHSFLNYEINAPWVQMARHSVLPFVSFFYRALPMFIETAKTKPWKIVKLLAFYQLASGIGAMLAGSDDDEEEKSLRQMPDAKVGRIWGVIPKMIRMPWNHNDESPVYLDIRRWVPVGDIVDIDQSASMLPSSLTPGGILVLINEVLFMNKSMFTKKDIVDDNDSITEQAEKRLDYLFKGMMPNLPLPNPLNTQIGSVQVNPFNLEQGSFQSYSWSGLEKSVNKTENAIGEVKSVPMAMASAFGIKLAAYPRANMEAQIAIQLRSGNQKIKDEMQKTARDYGNIENPSPKDTLAFERKITVQTQKIIDATQKAEEKLR